MNGYLKIVHILLLVLVFITTAGFSSCSSSIIDEQNNDSLPRIDKFIFNLSKKGYEEEMNTRADSEWEEGDKIYLLFSSNSGLAFGDAVFTNGNWVVNYDGRLIEDQLVTCKVFFFENEVSLTHATVTLNETSSIYEDINGSYELIDGSLSITATLRPKTGRIHFKGENHLDIKFLGISYFTSFNRYTGEYKTSDSQLTSKVSGEYTPYCYGFFTDSTEPYIKLWNESGSFIRYFSSDVFTSGQSGYVNIPLSKDHNGWLLLFE